MPNEGKPTTTPVAATSSKQDEQPTASSPKQPKSVNAPGGMPGREEPKDGAMNAGSKKTRDENKPLEIAVEQNAS